jgi:hypothetical protein
LPAATISVFKDLLELKGTPNGGNAVTDDLKYTSMSFFCLSDHSADMISVKFSRQNGIHVSPSVLWDGLYQSQIESSWDEKEWSNFFAQKLGD